jgi:hypothetical protein
VHYGLHYHDEGSDEVAFASKMSPYQELLLLHGRLGHPYFAAMSHRYPSLLMHVLGNLLYVMYVSLLNIQGFLILIWV